jgi:hypothetical protein
MSLKGMFGGGRVTGPHLASMPAPPPPPPTRASASAGATAPRPSDRPQRAGRGNLMTLLSGGDLGEGSRITRFLGGGS